MYLTFSTRYASFCVLHELALTNAQIANGPSKLSEQTDITATLSVEFDWSLLGSQGMHVARILRRILICVQIHRGSGPDAITVYDADKMSRFAHFQTKPF